MAIHYLVIVLTLFATSITCQFHTLRAAPTPIALHSGVIAAQHFSFVVWGNTTSYCPHLDGLPCPPGNVTATALNGYMSTGDVTGWQDILVTQHGQLSHNPAHGDGDVPPGGALVNFNVTNVTGHGIGTVNLQYMNQNWLACPLPKMNKRHETYEVFAQYNRPRNQDVPGGNVSACLEFEMWGVPWTSNGTAAVWDYD